MMVGRNIEDMFERTYQPRGEEALRVEDIKCGKRLRGASLNLHYGEIVGLAGLVGAGRTELARAIFGVDRLNPVRSSFSARKFTPHRLPKWCRKASASCRRIVKIKVFVLILPTSDNVVMASLEKIIPKFSCKQPQGKVICRWITSKICALPLPPPNASSSFSPEEHSKKWSWPNGFARKPKSSSLTNPPVGSTWVPKPRSTVL